jgi:DNA-directed RNA polymerase specialized sigma24 family protein
LDDVDDLTNNVYLSFAEQFETIAMLENWLRRVLFLTFVRWYKRNKSRTPVELNESILIKEVPATEFINVDVDADTALNVLSSSSQK